MFKIISLLNTVYYNAVFILLLYNEVSQRFWRARVSSQQTTQSRFSGAVVFMGRRSKIWTVPRKLRLCGLRGMTAGCGGEGGYSGFIVGRSLGIFLRNVCTQLLQNGVRARLCPCPKFVFDQNRFKSLHFRMCFVNIGSHILDSKAATNMNK